MPTIASNIDSLNHDIEKTEAALSSLYSDLGRAACQYHKAINCSESNEIFERLCNATEANDSIREQINGVQNALKQMDLDDRDINNTTISIKDLETRQNVLTASLGAVVIEIEAAGKLPPELSKCMKSAHDFEDTINKLIEKRDSYGSDAPGILVRIADRRIEKCKEGINGIFIDTGKKLLAHVKILKSMDNARIRAILEELETIRSNRKNFKSIIKSRQKSFSDASDSLKGQNTTLKDLLIRKEESDNVLDSLYTKYGEIIAGSMEKWLDSQAPEELTDICRRIKTEKLRLSKQELNMDYLNIEKNIQRNENMFRQFNTQLSHLRGQRATIDRQISDLQIKINELNLEMNTLKRRQEEIKKSAHGRQ